MKAGNFNINDYLERLFENAEGIENKEGLIIPDENKKSYDWLKKEYHAGQTEVKVEMKFQGAKFEPGYDLQTDLDSVKDFKPGMYGEVKTGDNEKPKSLDSKKEVPNFSKEEGEKEKEPKEEKKKNFKTKPEERDIKTKEEKPINKEEDPKVKKIDLKTKKNDK